MQRRTLKSLLGVAALAAVSGLSSAARANTSLFTTSSDWTGWGSGSITAAASTAFDADGSTTNGAGNNPGNSGSSINVGGTSTGGSLAFTSSSDLGYSALAFSPGEAYNPAFMAAIDPGSTAAYQAPNYTSGDTVAYSGTLLLTYTIPTFSSGTYFQLGVNLAYTGDGYYGTFFPTTTPTPTTIDGQSAEMVSIPYTITAGSLSGFSVAIQSNSDYVPTSTFYADNLEVVTASTPEPASLGLLAGAGLLGLRRRRA